MRYAAIADVHGNMPALEAVVADAKARGAEAFLFLGDYYGDLPYPNEVVDLVRALGGEAILGNKEGYLLELAKQDPTRWTDEQFSALYWGYRTLRPENLRYLSSLPPETDKRIEGVRLRASHQARRYFSDTNLMRLGSRTYALRMRERPFSHVEYLDYIVELTRNDAVFHERIKVLGGGVFVFGHSHIQWHLRVENTLLFNPGSCGLPLDFDTRAPYMLLDFTNGDVEIEERRVVYPVGQVIETLRASPIYECSPLWSEMVIRQLTNAEERASFFLMAIEELAVKMNRPIKHPFDNDVWREAGERWLAENR